MTGWLAGWLAARVCVCVCSLSFVCVCVCACVSVSVCLRNYEFMHVRGKCFFVAAAAVIEVL